MQDVENMKRAASGAQWDCGLLRLVDGGGAGDSSGDAGADVFGADVAFEFCLLHELSGLFADGAEPASVDGGHVAQAKDNDGGQRGDPIDDFVELVGGAEEKRSVHA